MPWYRWLFRLGFVVVVVAIVGTIVASRTDTVSYPPLPPGLRGRHRPRRSRDSRSRSRSRPTGACSSASRVAGSSSSTDWTIPKEACSPTCPPPCTTSRSEGSSTSPSTRTSLASPTSTRSTRSTPGSARSRRSGGTPGKLQDPCPGPENGTVDGCVGSGRLSRLTAVGHKGTRRACPARGLVRAVQHPHRRFARLRPGRRALRQRGRRRRLEAGRTTASSAIPRTRAATLPDGSARLQAPPRSRGRVAPRPVAAASRRAPRSPWTAR